MLVQPVLVNSVMLQLVVRVGQTDQARCWRMIVLHAYTCDTELGLSSLIFTSRVFVLISLRCSSVGLQ